MIDEQPARRTTTSSLRRLRGRSGNADILPGSIRLLLALTICLGVFFRFYHLDGKVLWEDEIFATVHMLGYTEAAVVEAAPTLVDAGALQRFFHLPDPTQQQHPLSATIHSLASEDPQHPPLYYVLGRLWMQRFGTTVSAMRSLSALFGVLVVAAMYALGRELFRSESAAWLGTAVVAVSPFHVLYAQEVREYSLWSVALLLLSLTFLRAVRLGGTGHWLLYTFVLASGLYIFPFTALVAAGQGLYLIVGAGPRSRRTLVAYLTAGVAGCALFAPWLSIMLRSGGLDRGMSGILNTRIAPLTVVTTLLRNSRSAFVDFGLFQLGPLHSTAINLGLTVIVMSLVAYALYHLVKREERSVWAFVGLAFLLPMLPLVARDLVSGGGLVNQSRYFTPLYLGLELAVVSLFRAALGREPGSAARRGRWAIGALLAGGVCSCVISSRAATWANKDYEQNRTIAQIVNAAANPLVVSDFNTSRTLGLGYYLLPSVRMRLNIHCDQCALVTPDRPNLLAGSIGSGDIFLLGASADVERQARAALARTRSPGHLRIIGVKTFTDHTNALTLFQPL